MDLVISFLPLVTLQTRVVQTQSCILQLVQTQLADGAESNKWQCELGDMDAWSAGKRLVDVEGLVEADFATVRSGDSTIYAEGATITNGVMTIPSGLRKTFGRSTRRGPAAAQEYANMEGLSPRQRRRDLSPIIEERSVLVVRVNAKDALNKLVASSLSNMIFGTSSNSLKERYASCSYDEVTFKPATGQDVTDGVTTISVSASATNADSSVVREAALNALTAKYGSLPSRFDHVMLCLPPGTRDNGNSWIGYGEFQKVHFFRVTCV
jgi:hypothetical protein